LKVCAKEKSGSYLSKESLLTAQTQKKLDAKKIIGSGKERERKMNGRETGNPSKERENGI